MSSRNSKNRTLPLSSPAAETVGAAPEPPSDRRPRAWMFRIAATIMGPLLFLGLVELALRLGGYGYSPHFFQHITIEGQPCLVDNPKFGYRFFPPKLARIPAPVVMQAIKRPGSIRIFILGESAALGDPRPQFGAGRYLEALLREKHPGQEFEIVNTATTAINSHVIREIASDCAAEAGDVWLVYMGNNEMVGPFGAATVFGPQAPPLWLVRLTVTLQEWRVGQLLASLSQRLKSSGSPTAEWRGMGMFLHNQVSPEDPRKARVYGSYRNNLEAIVNLGSRSGAKVVLSTLAVNLKDCPPFASLGTNSADQHFRLAQGSLLSSNADSAKRHFELARDYDALPFRADSILNGVIRGTARLLSGRGVPLCDAELALAGAAPGLIPGEESFYEHVHLNFDGNYRLAKAWAEAVEAALPASTTRGNSGWADQETCERRLGLTDWNRLSVVQEVIERLRQPPLSDQPNNAARLDRAQSWAAQLRERIRTNSIESSRALYVAGIAATPGDYRLHENFAEFLDATGDPLATLAERKRIRDLTPHYYFPHYLLGKTLKEQKQFEEARESLLKAAALNPNQPDIFQELGLVWALQSQWEKALDEFNHARSLSPNDARLHHLIGDVMWRLDQRQEAVAELRKAVELRSDYWEARYRLAEALGVSGQMPQAAAELLEVVRLKPDHVRARVNLGVALAQMRKPMEALQQLDEALRLDPGNQAALQLKRQIEANPK